LAKGAQRRKNRPPVNNAIIVKGLFGRGINSAVPPLVITARDVAMEILPATAKNTIGHPPRLPKSETNKHLVRFFSAYIFSAHSKLTRGKINSPFGSIAHDVTQQVPPITNKTPIRQNLNLGLSNRRRPIDVPIISAPPEAHLWIAVNS
jgi:hypothetical protein